MKYHSALLRYSHWSEFIKPAGYGLLVALPLGTSLLRPWAALLFGLGVGSTVFLVTRFGFSRRTPRSVELTPVGLTITTKSGAKESVAWDTVRKVSDDDELCGWRIEGPSVVRFGVAALSREGMSAIEAAIRENAKRHGFQVADDSLDTPSGSPRNSTPG